jgi:hypothetical protein
MPGAHVRTVYNLAHLGGTLARSLFLPAALYRDTFIIQTLSPGKRIRILLLVGRHRGAEPGFKGLYSEVASWCGCAGRANTANVALVGVCRWWMMGLPGQPATTVRSRRHPRTATAGSRHRQRAATTLCSCHRPRTATAGSRHRQRAATTLCSRHRPRTATAGSRHRQRAATTLCSRHRPRTATAGSRHRQRTTVGMQRWPTHGLRRSAHGSLLARGRSPRISSGA